MTKFSTPVSMQVTKEQYEKDLRDPLLKMGYKEYEVLFMDNNRFIVTNHCGQNGVVTDLGIFWNCEKEHNRYFIDHYNPELFLALAGMRDDKEIRVGDWVILNLHGGTVYNVDDISIIYTAKKIKILGIYEHIGFFRKATKEEIIQHFTKQEAKPEKPEPIFRKGDTVHHWSYGKGEVIKGYDHSANVKFEKYSAFEITNDELSFTPYNLVTGGFSQERPKPNKYKIEIEVEWRDMDKVTLTNKNGDTYTSKSQELMDFLHTNYENPLK